ncbi:MAG: hypothetical protein ABIN97_12705 [Ginsengibacter sp.]
MKKLLLLLLLITGIQRVFSQWNSNTSINNLVANRPQNEIRPLSVTDGANGSIVIFNTNNDNNSSNNDIYAQKITSAGTIAWGSTSNPIIVCNASDEQYYTDAIADGAGGAYIVWEDFRNDPVFGEIYIQHINSSGVALWPANGVRVTNTSNDDYSAFLCSDGSGGVIVAWNWDNNVNNIQISAQKYNSAGVAQWVANGVQVSTAPGFRAGTNIVSDGASGAILFFLDTRDDTNGTDYDYVINPDTDDLENINIYAQRLNSNGIIMWSNNDVVVCNAPGNQGNLEIEENAAVPDGSGGAIFVFDDGRNDVPDIDGDPTNFDIYAQKLNSSGVAQWSTNGVPFTIANDNQYLESVERDGAGGIVAVWFNGNDDHEYTQRINSAGTINWTLNGIMLNSVESYYARIIADGSGNYMYSFLNFALSGITLGAQKLNGAGALQWGANGIVVCNNPVALEDFSSPTMVLSDNGAAIISWADKRNFNTTSNDIFASKVLSIGVLAGTGGSGYISIADGNWNNPAIWSGGAVPPATAQVTVKHNVTVTQNATCDSLSVELPGNIIVKTGINLIVTH